MEITTSAKTPRVVTRFIEAMNQSDALTASACFTDDASVDEQFGHHVGRAAIQQWILTVFRDFQPTLLPLRRVTSTVDASLAVSLSGRFPGSPVQVDFHFTLSGRRIARLTIDG
jgi:hypothetical protein